MSLVKTKRKIGYFNSYILQRIENNKNFIACITGSTGSGKSWSALREGETLDPDFDIDNVCFTGRQFMDLVNGKSKQLKKGSVIVFDEIQVTMGHLDYQSLQAKLLNYVLQTFRHRNFILFMTSPHFNFINASARRLFHCRMETVSINKETKQVNLKPFLLQINQDTGDVYRKYLRIYHKDYGVVPFTLLKLGKPSNKLIKDYEEKKTEFTKQLNESISKDLKRLEEGEEPKPLTEKQKEIVQDLTDGLTLPKIAKKRNIDISAVYEYLRLIKKKGFKIKPKKDKNKVICYEVSGFEAF
jgi:hypothetical protein